MSFLGWLRPTNRKIKLSQSIVIVVIPFTKRRNLSSISNGKKVEERAIVQNTGVFGQSLQWIFLPV